MKVNNNQQYQVWHGDEIEGILDIEWRYIEYDLVIQLFTLYIYV